MSGRYTPAPILARCAHGAVRGLERCALCEEEERDARETERRRAGDPAIVILDAVERRRPWFRRCAFCAHESETAHDPGCPWRASVDDALPSAAVVERFLEERCPRWLDPRQALAGLAVGTVSRLYFELGRAWERRS